MTPDSQTAPLLVCAMADRAGQGCSTIAALAASAGSMGHGEILVGSVGQDPYAPPLRGAKEVVIPSEVEPYDAASIVEAFAGRRCFLDVASGVMDSDAPVSETMREIMTNAYVCGYHVVALLPARADDPEAIRAAVELGNSLPDVQKIVVRNDITGTHSHSFAPSPFPCVDVAYLGSGFIDLAWASDNWFFLNLQRFGSDVAQLCLIAWMRRFTNQLSSYGLFADINHALSPIDEFDDGAYDHCRIKSIEDTTNEALRRMAISYERVRRSRSRA